MMHCLICHCQLSTGDSWFSFFFPKLQSLLCEECSGKLEPIQGEVCMQCGRPMAGLPHAYKLGDQCLDCSKWQENGEVLDCNCSVYVYNDFMKEIMTLFKFRGDVALAKAFASPLKAIFSRQFSSCAVVPIPLSQDRLVERGFNQAEVLASLLGVKIYEDALKRTHAKKQSKKSRRERMMSESPFEILALPSQRILLIDDIYTTGTTVRQAAALFRQKGATFVASLTLVRSVGDMSKH